MKRKAAAIIGGVALGIATLFVVGEVTPKAPDICVTYYEDAGQSGDHNAACAIGATNVHVANFGSLTAGLHNGCNRGLNQSSTWNDCISSGSVGLLPAGTKIQWWRDINYGGGLLACYDVDGTHTFDLSGTSDLISSMRIIAGSC